MCDNKSDSDMDIMNNTSDEHNNISDAYLGDAKLSSLETAVLKLESHHTQH